MRITTSAAHGQLIEALSRLTVLVREHGDELPALYVTASSDTPTVCVQVCVSGGPEYARRSAVEHLAQLLKLKPPIRCVSGTYLAGNDLWQIYTPPGEPTGNRPSA